MSVSSKGVTDVCSAIKLCSLVAAQIDVRGWIRRALEA